MGTGLVTLSGAEPLLHPDLDEILERVTALGKSVFDYANDNRFQRNLANDRPNDWHYGPDDLMREYHRVKACAPLCTVGCVHRVTQVDELRAHPQVALAQWFAEPAREGESRLPPAVRILMGAFVTGPRRNLFRSAAVRFFGARQRH